MKYFEFKYIVTDKGQIVKQGDALYYTGAEQNINEMKDVVRHIIKNPATVVSIPLVNEIDRQVFIQKGGNPKV